MAKLVRRGKYWHFDFRFQGQRYQGSTFLKNKEKAESYVAKFRTNLVETGIGLIEKAPAPILSVFLEGDFLSWVRQNEKKPRTTRHYEQKVKRLVSYPPFTLTRLDGITEQLIQGYKDMRLAKGIGRTAVNHELATLRKAMIYADVCGLTHYRKIRLLPAEPGRTFILDGELESRYLELADYPLKQVAILVLDLGLRPEEAVSLRKSDISRETVHIRGGKTPNARRSLPHTGRSRSVFDLCFALFPDSEWVFPGSKGQHFTRGALDNLHTALRKEHNLPEEFVLYSCRHTFGTRLAESGASVFQIKAAMGHASVKTSEKYIHPSADNLIVAMKQKELLDQAIRGEVHANALEGQATKRPH